MYEIIKLQIGIFYSEKLKVSYTIRKEWEEKLVIIVSCLT